MWGGSEGVGELGFCLEGGDDKKEGWVNDEGKGGFVMRG